MFQNQYTFYKTLTLSPPKKFVLFSEQVFFFKTNVSFKINLSAVVFKVFMQGSISYTYPNSTKFKSVSKHVHSLHVSAARAKLARQFFQLLGSIVALLFNAVSSTSGTEVLGCRRRQHWTNENFCTKSIHYKVIS